MQWTDASDEWSKLDISSTRVGLNCQKLSTVYENIKAFKIEEFSNGLKKVEQRKQYYKGITKSGEQHAKYTSVLSSTIVSAIVTFK